MLKRNQIVTTLAVLAFLTYNSVFFIRHPSSSELNRYKPCQILSSSIFKKEFINSEQKVRKKKHWKKPTFFLWQPSTFKYPEAGETKTLWLRASLGTPWEQPLCQKSHQPLGLRPRLQKWFQSECGACDLKVKRVWVQLAPKLILPWDALVRSRLCQIRSMHASKVGQATAKIKQVKSKLDPTFRS